MGARNIVNRGNKTVFGFLLLRAAEKQRRIQERGWEQSQVFSVYTEPWEQPVVGGCCRGNSVTNEHSIESINNFWTFLVCVSVCVCVPTSVCPTPDRLCLITWKCILITCRNSGILRLCLLSTGPLFTGKRLMTEGWLQLPKRHRTTVDSFCHDQPFGWHTSMTLSIPAEILS